MATASARLLAAELARRAEAQDGRPPREVFVVYEVDGEDTRVLAACERERDALLAASVAALDAPGEFGVLRLPVARSLLEALPLGTAPRGDLPLLRFEALPRYVRQALRPDAWRRPREP